MSAKTIKQWLTRLSPELSIKLQYLYYFRRPLRLNNPKTLDEKIQWMKLNLYDKDPLFTICADKYRVREYITKSGCPEILNDLIAVYEYPEQVEWDTFPDKFVVKWNFGNGFNIICRDKNTLNIPQTIAVLKKWGRYNSWLTNGEVQYRDIPKRIVVEKYIDDGFGGAPLDYKVYCFHGVAKFLFVCVGREKGKPKFYYFDRDWRLAPLSKDSIDAPKGFSLPRPKHLEEIFHYAEVLSQPFPFVRVDFFDTPEQLYFGELTFTPGGGLDFERLPETQIILGDLLHLDTVKGKPQ